jgi:hypothetical protein
MSVVAYESAFALQCHESLALWDDMFVVHDPRNYTMAWVLAIAVNTSIMFFMTYETTTPYLQHYSSDWVLHVRADPLKFVTDNVTRFVRTIPLALVYRIIAFTLACTLWLLLRYETVEGCEYVVPVIHANTLLLINWMEVFCGRTPERIVIGRTSNKQE